MTEILISIIQTNSQRPFEEINIFSSWMGWLVAICLFIVFFLYDAYNRLRKSIIIKAYIEKDDKVTKTRSLSPNLSIIGAYKREKYNKEMGAYEITMGWGRKNFILYSKYTMKHLMERHCIEKVYLIFYSLNCFVYKKEIRQPYYKELGYSFQAKVYRVYTFLFNWSSTGFVFGPILLAILFFYFVKDIPNNFSVGFLIGEAFSLINGGFKRTDLAKKILKPGTQLIEKEEFLAPLESEVEILDVYHVKGYRQIPVKTPDGAIEKKKMKLSDEKDVDYVQIDNYETLYNLQQKPEVEIQKIDTIGGSKYRVYGFLNEGVKYEILRSKETLAYLEVIGYEELYKLQTDPLVRIDEIQTVGTIERQRSFQEMLNLDRSWLARNRAMAEDNFRQQKEIIRHQNVIRELEEQKQFLIEEKDKELRQAILNSAKEAERLNKTIRGALSEVYGSVALDLAPQQAYEKVVNAYEREKLMATIREINSYVEMLRQILGVIKGGITEEGKITGDNLQKINHLFSDHDIALTIQQIRGANAEGEK